METKLVDRVSFRDSDHSYTLEGKRIPSVTGILDNLSKPALPWWAAKVGAEAVTEWLCGRVTNPDGNVEAARVVFPAHEISHVFDLAQRAHIRIRNSAGKKGSAVHNAIDKFHTNFFEAEPPAEPDEIAAWEAFLEWWGGAGLTAVETERKIVDPAGRYAGRLDLVAKDSAGQLYVCDIKTSNSVHMAAILQNAAYAHAIESEGEYTIRGTKVLWLPSGCTKMTVVERDREEWFLDYSIFDALVQVHSYRKGMDAWMRTINEGNAPTKETTE